MEPLSQWHSLRVAMEISLPGLTHIKCHWSPPKQKREIKKKKWEPIPEGAEHYGLWRPSVSAAGAQQSSAHGPWLCQGMGLKEKSGGAPEWHLQKGEKNPTNSLTQRSRWALCTSLPPITSGVAEQGCHLKHILCSASKIMLFLANIGIVALSPGRWGEKVRDGGGKKRGCNSAWKC